MLDVFTDRSSSFFYITMSSKAICSFENCKCPIIDVEDSHSVEVPKSILERFQIMENKNRGHDVVKPNSFQIVKDIWDFDNIGVSKDIPVDNFLPEDSTETITFEYEGETWTITKCVNYLICADCDKGPIGIVCNITTVNGEISKTINMLSLLSVDFK